MFLSVSPAFDGRVPITKTDGAQTQEGAELSAMLHVSWRRRRSGGGTADCNRLPLGLVTALMAALGVSPGLRAFFPPDLNRTPVLHAMFWPTLLEAMLS